MLLSSSPLDPPDPSEAIADSETDKLVDWECDVWATEYVYVRRDQDITPAGAAAVEGDR